MNLIQLKRHFKKHRNKYLFGGFLFLALAIYLRVTGKIVEIPFFTQSLFGIGYGFLNAGIILAIIGGILLMIPPTSVFGLFILLGGILMAGGSVLATIVGFFREIGTIGMIIIAGVIFLLIWRKIKK